VTNAAGAQVLRTTTGICDQFKGCDRTQSDRLCNLQRCLNSTTLEIEAGSCPQGATACATRIVTCQNGCSVDKCN
jgi:hypothetical protein